MNLIIISCVISLSAVCISGCQTINSVKCPSDVSVNIAYQKKIENCELLLNKKKCEYYSDKVTKLQISCSDLNHSELYAQNKNMLIDRAVAERKQNEIEKQIEGYLSKEKSDPETSQKSIQEECEKNGGKILIKPKYNNFTGFTVDYINSFLQFEVNLNEVTCSEDFDNTEYYLTFWKNDSKDKYNVNVEIDGEKYGLRKSDTTRILFTYGDRAKYIMPTVNIESVSLHNVLPKYNNEDTYLTAYFNGRSFSVKNKTKQIIKIGSIWMYYNNTIMKKIFPNLEIPPEYTKEDIYLTFNDEEINSVSSFMNITKDNAKDTIINYGYAIKYTIGSQNDENTLYRQVTYPLAELIPAFLTYTK